MPKTPPTSNPHCPECGLLMVKNGFIGGVRRYRCKHCGKTLLEQYKVSDAFCPVCGSDRTYKRDTRYYACKDCHHTWKRENSK